MSLIAEVYRRNKLFLLIYLAIFTFTAIICLSQPKVQIHIFINQLHSPFQDQFFRFLTYLGSGYFLIFVMVLIALFKKRAAGALLISGLLLNFLVQLLKHLIHAYRPAYYFELFVPEYQLHLVKGVNMHHLHSFPSGHAATAFAIFFVLAHLTNKQWLKLLYLLMAVLVAYSRVYLSQHFLHDILVGSLIGVISAYLGIIWLLSMEKLSEERL